MRRFSFGATYAIGALSIGANIIVANDRTPANPTITVVGGNNQTGAPGQFNPKPFDIAVWNAAGTEPLVDTDVTFCVQFGGGQLSSDNTAAPLPGLTLTLHTDEDGTVQAYYKQPAVPGILSQIKASVGAAELVLETRSLAAAAGDASTTAGHTSEATAADVAARGGARFNGSGSTGAASASASTARTSKSGDSLNARALTLAASLVKIRTPASQYYAVNTSTWAISSTTP